jgi:endonuclease/exonuclease/phosphatase family metal-dependent hydrolase
MDLKAVKGILAIVGLLLLAVAAVQSQTSASFAAPPVTREGLTVASLNLARATDAEGIVRELRQQGLVPAADVLLFQEVAKPQSGDVGEAVGKMLGYSMVAIPSDASAPNQGLTILSRGPLEDVRVVPLKRFDLKFHSRVRFAVGAVTRIDGERVRVWNVHLDTRINPEERLAQLEPVFAEADREVGAAVIGGDFNTVDFRWFLNVIPMGSRGSQGIAVRRRMEGIGFLAALADGQVTYPFLNQHLDWIFARGLKNEGSGVVRMGLSDHHAVWARLR